MNILKRDGVKSILDGSLIIVELEGEEQYDTIRDAVVEANATLRRLAPRRHELADIFRGIQE